jgi:DNA (cytosine-5)-methyltransferase 1
MRELSLFSGAGGGLLGTKLLGWECIGYVETNSYCQQVIRARIDDGIFDPAPIFGDVIEFSQPGGGSPARKLYRGVTDVITAGFPCQPFSQSGARLGDDDPRNMWGATLAVINEVRPRFAFLENVSGLLSIDNGRIFGRIIGDLGEIGYDCRWRILSAAEVGAPHKRDRLWIVADTDGAGLEGRERPGGTDSQRRKIENGSTAKRRSLWWEHDPADSTTQSRVGRVVDGVANRVDRLKAIGNGQVPAVAATAWRLLTEGEDLK